MNSKNKQYRIRECAWSEGYTSFHAESLREGEAKWSPLDPVSFQLTYEHALDCIKSDRTPYVCKEAENNVEPSYRVSEIVHVIK